MQDVSLSAIHLSEVQRFLAEPDEIERYTAFHAERGVLPPVQLNQDGQVLGGVEYVLVAESLGLTHIRAVVEPRTPEQKRKDILALLGDPKWCLESSKAIARYCYVYRKLVVKVRAHYSDPTEPRNVQRGDLTYAITPTAPRSNVPVYLYDERFASPKLPPDFADVILTVPPCDAIISDLARRMAIVLGDEGTAYLLFTPEQTGEVHTWRRELESAGLPFGALLCWTVKDCASGLPGFEHILVMGQLPRDLLDKEVITGPRAHDARDAATLYRKSAWLAARLLKAHQGQVMLDPFVRTSFALKGAQRAGVKNASGYLLSSEYREEAAPFVVQA